MLHTIREDLSTEILYQELLDENSLLQIVKDDSNNPEDMTIRERYVDEGGRIHTNNIWYFIAGVNQAECFIRYTKNLIAVFECIDEDIKVINLYDNKEHSFIDGSFFELQNELENICGEVGKQIQPNMSEKTYTLKKVIM